LPSVVGIPDVVGCLWAVLAVALHGGMSSKISKNTNLCIRHPIGYLTERGVYFPASSNWVHIIEWLRYVRVTARGGLAVGGNGAPGRYGAALKIYAPTPRVERSPNKIGNS
jgi:hypothetical protein